MSKSEKVINTLLGHDIKIIQQPDMFNYSLDSTLLADFVQISKNVQTIIDLGTGNAVIPLLLSLKTAQPITGVEIQPDVYTLAKQNIELNALSKQITIINNDINQLNEHYKHKAFDLVIANPPFFKVDPNSNINASDYKTLARHEVKITLNQLFKQTKYLLNDYGHFYLVHRASRLDDIIKLVNDYGFAIKRLRFVHPKIDKEANMVLIDMMKNGAQTMRILPPLIVHNDDGDYTETIKKIFNYES